jgi:tetraacyldisaccharide 4'-kinase
VAVREEEMEYVAPRVKPLLREGTLIWTVRRRLRFPEPLLVLGAGLRPVALCAIARPEGFETMLREAGCGIVDTIYFRDHHAFDLADMGRAVEMAKQLNATGFVTTEKDAVKLTAAMREKLETLGPLMVAALDVEFIFPERVARELEERISRKQEKV